MSRKKKKKAGEWRTYMVLGFAFALIIALMAYMG